MRLTNDCRGVSRLLQVLRISLPGRIALASKITNDAVLMGVLPR